MKVLTAEVLGMCFGVRDALNILAEVQRPGEVTVHGELVHNEQVLEQLHARGFRMTREEARRPLPVTPRVMITAHGVSDVERARLEAAGKTLIDTTCPLVSRVHKAAQGLREDYRNMTMADFERQAEHMAFGTAKEVTERIIAAAESAGANQVQISLNRGALPQEMFLEQIRRFAREVLPALQAHEVKRVPLGEESEAAAVA